MIVPQAIDRGASEMTTDSKPFTIREVQAADVAALRRLAAGDSGQLPAGRILVGEVDGEIIAAAPVAGGSIIADPFRPPPSPANLIELRTAAAALREHLSTRAKLRGLARRRRSGRRLSPGFVAEPAT
jgi:hypothetical protein